MERFMLTNVKCYNFLYKNGHKQPAIASDLIYLESSSIVNFKDLFKRFKISLKMSLQLL